MHRRRLLELLASYAPTGADDGRARDDIEAFVRAEPACFERTTVSGHVTGSALVVDPRRRFVLLHHHRKLDRWLQFGGHCDGDGDVEAVARRETREECGLDGLARVGSGVFDVDVHAIPARGDEPRHLHYDVRFLLEADSSATLAISDESRELRWIAAGDAAGLDVDGSVLRMIRKAGLG